MPASRSRQSLAASGLWPVARHHLVLAVADRPDPAVGGVRPNARRAAGTPSVAAGFSDRAIASYRLSFGAASLAAAINCVFGLLVAWVIVRYRFPGRAAGQRAGRPAVRAADRGRRHRADLALRRHRPDRRPAGAAWPAGRLQAGRRGPGAGVHRPAVRRADGRAGARRRLARDRGSRADPRREPAADLRYG